MLEQLRKSIKKFDPASEYPKPAPPPLPSLFEEDGTPVKWITASVYVPDLEDEDDIAHVKAYHERKRLLAEEEERLRAEEEILLSAPAVEVVSEPSIVVFVDAKIPPSEPAYESSEFEESEEEADPYEDWRFGSNFEALVKRFQNQRGSWLPDSKSFEPVRGGSKTRLNLNDYMRFLMAVRVLIKADPDFDIDINFGHLIENYKTRQESLLAEWDYPIEYGDCPTMDEINAVQNWAIGKDIVVHSTRELLDIYTEWELAILAANLQRYPADEIRLLALLAESRFHPALSLNEITVRGKGQVSIPYLSNFSLEYASRVFPAWFFEAPEVAGVDSPDSFDFPWVYPPTYHWPVCMTATEAQELDTTNHIYMHRYDGETVWEIMLCCHAILPVDLASYLHVVTKCVLGMYKEPTPQLNYVAFNTIPDAALGLDISTFDVNEPTVVTFDGKQWEYSSAPAVDYNGNLILLIPARAEIAVTVRYQLTSPKYYTHLTPLIARESGLFFLDFVTISVPFRTFEIMWVYLVFDGRVWLRPFHMFEHNAGALVTDLTAFEAYPFEKYSWGLLSTCFKEIVGDEADLVKASLYSPLVEAADE